MALMDSLTEITVLYPVFRIDQSPVLGINAHTIIVRCIHNIKTQVPGQNILTITKVLIGQCNWNGV